MGKTRLLKRLNNHIDLEDLAQHRSSVFGGINLKPRNQRDFEAHLVDALTGINDNKPVWIEGESRKIGDVIIPQVIRDMMVKGMNVLVVADMETRIARIAEEYFDSSEETKLQLSEALSALKNSIGAQIVGKLQNMINENEVGEVVKILSEEHYDSRYQHAMKNYKFDFTVCSNNIEDAYLELINLHRTIN